MSKPPRGGRREGRPDPASVVARKTFASPAGRRYRILRTDQRDAYDPSESGLARPGHDDTAAPRGRREAKKGS